MTSPEDDSNSVPLGDLHTYPIYKEAIDLLIEQTPQPIDAQTAIEKLDTYLRDLRQGTAATKFPELTDFPGEVTFEHSLGTEQIAVPHFFITGKINEEEVLKILVRHWKEYGWDCATSTARQ